MCYDIISIRQQMHGRTTQFRISFIVYLCLVHLLQLKGREKSAPLCKFRKYSLTDWALNQSFVSRTTLRHPKTHHL